VQELLDRGVITADEARVWPRRNVITRAVGVEEEIATDMELGQARPGDVFVLNTDGLAAHVNDAEILEAASSRPPQEACEALVEKVLERGGTDNVTIVVVKCHDATGAADEERTFVPVMGLDRRNGR
jgi:protein phosphatase